MARNLAIVEDDPDVRAMLEKCLESDGYRVTSLCGAAGLDETLAAGDIDLWEINEAFAAVPLKMSRDLAIDRGAVNVNGGAIALGHPIGATGAMLVGTLLDELERRDLSTGLVAMCTGGGMGTATVLERV